ncbi:MAG: RC-LH1 core complex protein PufX [Rhodobacter sp.]|nr:RC-LH1 core complex protein PufX [Rhodobacter sp.]
MSNKEWFLEHEGAKPSLYGWVFRHMAMGAVYAALVLFGLIAVMLVIYAIGELLPEDSKTAPEPMPQIESQLRLDDGRHVI